MSPQSLIKSVAYAAHHLGRNILPQALIPSQMRAPIVPYATCLILYRTTVWLETIRNIPFRFRALGGSVIDGVKPTETLI